MTRQSNDSTQRRRIFDRVRDWTHRGDRTPLPPGEAPRLPRSVRDAITEKFGTGAYDKVRSPSTQIAQALTAKPVYQGTVAQAVIARRRAANKRARAARRIHRQAAGR